MLPEGLIQSIIERFVEQMSIPMLLALLAVLGVTFYIITTRKIQWALILMLVLSLLTASDFPALSASSVIGRWFFLALAAGIALMQIRPGHPAILTVTSMWAAINLIGLLFAPFIENAAARAAFFLFAIPTFMLSMGPPAESVKSLLELVRKMAWVGILLALMHVYFIAIAPRGGAISRFASFFASPQPMSLATSTVTLPLIWMLLSKKTGRMFFPVVVAVIINLTVMVASTQRTALFSLVGAVGLMLLFYRGRGTVIALSAIGALIVLSPVITFLVDASFLKERLSSVDASNRTWIWKPAFEAALESPFFGHGNGAATVYAQLHFGKKFHQAYLAVFYDYGAVGILVFAAMIILGCWFAFRLARSPVDEQKALGVFLLASIAQVAVQGLVETGLADTANQTATQFYLSLGIVAAAMQMPEVKAALNRNARIPPLAATVLARRGLLPAAPAGGPPTAAAPAPSRVPARTARYRKFLGD